MFLMFDIPGQCPATPRLRSTRTPNSSQPTRSSRFVRVLTSLWLLALLCPHFNERGLTECCIGTMATLVIDMFNNSLVLEPFLAKTSGC